MSSDGTSWATLGLPVVSYLDSGEYICKANNSLGVTEAFVSLNISDSEITGGPGANSKEAGNVKMRRTEEATAYNGDIITTSASPTLGSKLIHADTEGILAFQDEALHLISNKRHLLASPPTDPQDSAPIVKSVRVTGDTDHSVSVAWKAPLAKNPTVFSVLYAIFGERDMRRINVEPGKVKVTIPGLMPKTKYIVCICAKGLIPRKEQCIIFSTDDIASTSGTQKLINIVVISTACVIAVPLTLVVCCGALKRRCKKCLTQKTQGNSGLLRPL